MRITFVYPDFVVGRKYPHSKQLRVTPGGWYSEGLASLSAVLKAAGHKVSLIHIRQPAKRESFEQEIKKKNPDIVGFTARTSAFSYIKEYLRWTKEIDPTFRTILGGVHPTIAPEECIKAEGADFICQGEGERPLIDLCQALEKRQDTSRISNLLIKKQGQIIRNPARKTIFPLDSLPLPDFELFDFPNLISSQLKVATVMVSRGCPYSCGYCCNHKLRQVYPDPEHYTRFRSPQNIMLYLKKLLRLYPWIASIRFWDNILGIEKTWLKEFSELYKKEIGLPFSCDHRSNLADYETLKLLKDAGCYQIYFGVETGNEELRKNILCRYITNQQTKESFKNCQKLGMKTLAYNIVGLPFETPPKTLETIKLNAKINPGNMVVNVFTPFPHTKLYDVCLKEKFITDKPIDYRDQVFINQPGFSKKQVLFLTLYFKFFVRLYRYTRNFPAFWELWDKIILCKYLPQKPLIYLMQAWESSKEYLKELLRKKMPFLYIFVRNRIKKIDSHN